MLVKGATGLELTGWLWNVTFIFGRCRRSLAAVPSVKYGYDWFKNANLYFCKIENFSKGEINELGFSTPTPGTNWYQTIYFNEDSHGIYRLLMHHGESEHKYKACAYLIRIPFPGTLFNACDFRVLSYIFPHNWLHFRQALSAQSSPSGWIIPVNTPAQFVGSPHQLIRNHVVTEGGNKIHFYYQGHFY